MGDEPKKDKKMTSIEDVISKLSDPDYINLGAYVTNAFSEVRAPTFTKHYTNSLDEKEKEKFAKLSDGEKSFKIAQSEYKLPHEHAEAFIRDLALNALKVLDAAENEKAKIMDSKGKDGQPMKTTARAEAMEKAMKVLEDKEATADEKAHALSIVEDNMGLVKQYLPQWDDFIRAGKEIGFSQKLFDNYAKEFGQTYLSRTNASHFKTNIKHDDAKKYIKDVIAMHPKLKDRFNVDTATHENVSFDKSINIITKYMDHILYQPETAKGHKSYIKDNEMKTYFKKAKPANT